VHPKQAKSDLARRIVADFHSAADADRAAAAFEARFSRGELQIDDLPVLTIDIDDESVGLAKLLSLAGLASSASDATRKIQQGGARVNREKVSDARMRSEPSTNAVVLEAGRKAVRVIVRRAP
jgi:tyrosyl-tRNA synthetase